MASYLRENSPALYITVWFLELLIRLLQAHARLMNRDTVTLQDKFAVVLIVESSTASVEGVNENNSNWIHPDDCLYQ